MIKVYLSLLILCLSITAKADELKWTRLGFEFECSPQICTTGVPQEFKNQSTMIANHVSMILANKIPQDVKDLVITKKLIFYFGKKLQPDAFFMPPQKDGDEDHLIVINPDVFTNPKLYNLISHEYFHFIHYQFNPDEKDWIKEGLAQYFEFMISGQINNQHVEKALSSSNFPLESDFNIEKYEPEKYGNSFLFFYNLFQKCIDDQKLWDYIKSKRSGREGIEFLLSLRKISKAYCQSFNAIATNYSFSKIFNTYTGYEQKKDFFLIPVLTLFSSKKTKPEIQQVKYKPLRMSSDQAKAIPLRYFENAVLISIQNDYPNQTSSLKPTDIQKLTPNQDLGVVIAD